jgi:hypothetical protein
VKHNEPNRSEERDFTAENGFDPAMGYGMWLAFLFAAMILASFSLFTEEETN